ncbi:uncharacterized protein IWZ02DRAFT_513846 [Phyllosticta citriasiana]|uniref:uncharacterized protein n=1 Tax=Phyllosticta citriasiana TaxID=595635 RepID=UPI0030FDE853
MAKSRSAKHKRSEQTGEQFNPAKRAKSTSEMKKSHSVGQGGSEDEESCQSPTSNTSLSTLPEDDRDLFQLVGLLKSEVERQNTGIEEVLALQRGQRPKFEEIAAQWSQEKEELEQKLVDKEREMDECVTELQLFHERSLKCEDSKWMPEGDQSIAFAVKDLQSSIRTWARKYSVDSFEKLFPWKQPKDEFYKQQAFFRQVLRITSIKDFQSLKEMENPFLVFAALLSDFILRAIFEDPFFHWRDPSNMKGEFTFRVMAKKMFEEMLSDDVVNAVTFRVNILRHNFPESSCPHTNRAAPDEFLCPRSVSKDGLKSIYNYLRQFLDGPPPLWIPREMDDSESLEMNQALGQVLHRAGNLHLRLMTHRTLFEWMQPQTVAGKSFKAKDSALQADQINDVLDQKDETWNGEKIQMVVGTGLMARGDAFGNDFSRRRLIAPSRVYLQNYWS